MLFATWTLVPIHAWKALHFSRVRVVSICATCITFVTLAHVADVAVDIMIDAIHIGVSDWIIYGLVLFQYAYQNMHQPSVVL